LGYPAQALQWSHEAQRLARELAHPFSLGFALFLTSWVPQFRREGLLTHERAEAAIALAAEHGFAVFGAGGTIFRGWALAARSIELGPDVHPTFLRLRHNKFVDYGLFEREWCSHYFVSDALVRPGNIS
jgi:hypothetical protein